MDNGSIVSFNGFTRYPTGLITTPNGDLWTPGWSLEEFEHRFGAIYKPEDPLKG